MPHSNCTSPQHTHPLERTPVPHLKGCVLVVSLVFLQHFCLVLCLTPAARCAFLQQTTCHLPQHPYSQDVPPEFLFKALGLGFFFPSLPLQFFPVIRIIFALCFCRATDKEGEFDSSSGCFCLCMSHKWSLLEPEQESEPPAGVNAQLWLYPCHFFSLLLMCRNSARKAQFFSGLYCSELFRSRKVNFVCKPHEPLACFPGRCREDTGHLFASLFLCQSMVTSALFDIACAVCRMLKRGFYDCCLSGNSKKIRYLSHEVRMVGKNI